MLDRYFEAQKVKFILALIIFYPVSMYLSCREIKYAIWGETTTATVTQCKKGSVPRRRGRSEDVLGVKYEFTQEDGTPRKGIMNMGLDWKPRPGGTFTIEYLPDKYRVERLPGEHDYIGVGFFFVMTSLVVVYLVIIVRRSKA